MKHLEYFLYNLEKKEGWLLDSSKEDQWYSKHLKLGRTNFREPWHDGKIHFHTSAQEIYFIVKGEIWLIIDNKPLILHERNILLVQPNIPHAVVGGKGTIQHYMMKIPHSNDEKIVLNEAPSKEDFLSEYKRNNEEINQNGCFLADLSMVENQNCWLIGYGSAKYHSEHFVLAYIYYKDEIQFSKEIHPNQLHYHKESEEWYFVLNGSQKLQIGNEEITIKKNHLLKIPENIPHKLISYDYPYEGMTIRTPNKIGDKVILNNK